VKLRSEVPAGVAQNISAPESLCLTIRALLSIGS